MVEVLEHVQKRFNSTVRYPTLESKHSAVTVLLTYLHFTEVHICSSTLLAILSIRTSITVFQYEQCCIIAAKIYEILIAQH